MKMDITQRCYLLIEDLSVARGERVVFGGVSLRLGSGEIAEVTGPNGVGKSTLLRAIAGFLPLGSGRMSWVESEAQDRRPGGAPPLRGPSRRAEIGIDRPRKP